MTRYTVRVLDGDSEGKSIDLPTDGSFSIGRKPGCDLVLTGDDKVSGRHAEIAIEGPMLILRDLGSTNGTRVDSRRIQEIPISHGDRFQIGSTQIQLVDEDAAPVQDESMSLEIDAAMLKRSSPPLMIDQQVANRSRRDPVEVTATLDGNVTSQQLHEGVVQQDGRLEGMVRSFTAEMTRSNHP